MADGTGSSNAGAAAGGEGAENKGGAAGANQNANNAGNQNAANANQNANAGTSDADGKNGGERTFTQAEVNALISQRLKDEKKRIEKEQRDAQLSETEKLTKRAEEAEAKARAIEAKDAFVGAATEAKARNPAKLFRLYERELLFGDDGKPANIAGLLSQAKRDFPDEFGAAKGSADGGSGNGNQSAGGGNSDMNRMIRQAAGRAS